MLFSLLPFFPFSLFLSLFNWSFSLTEGLHRKYECQKVNSQKVNSQKVKSQKVKSLERYQ